MAFASPVVEDLLALKIYLYLVPVVGAGCSPIEKHGFYSLVRFLCTQKKASRMVGLNFHSALCTPEVRVELGLAPHID